MIYPIKRFVEGKDYLFTGYPVPRKSSGATLQTKWRCVAVGVRFAVVYFDGRKCGSKETTIVVEHGDGHWKEA